jgi:hypothetical protein
MSMSIVPMIIVTAVLTMIIVIPMLTMIIVMMISTVEVILFFAEDICLIPCRLDKYLKGRVEVHDKYKKNETQYPKYDQEDKLYSRYRKECDDARYHKWQHEKYNRHDQCT